MTMRTLKLTLEYDGSGFAGWQFQPGQRTVQAEVEKALLTLTGEELRVEAAGRTDAGVHALGQVISFRTGSPHPAEVFGRALNALLPGDVAVLSAEEAGEDFHARKSARGKWYRYLIQAGGIRPALDRSRVWWLPVELDLAAMRAGAEALIGTHDFTSFCAADHEVRTRVRELRRVEVYGVGAGRVVLDFWASGFLKQMARILTGTLVEVGRGLRPAGEIGAILAARDRTRAGMTAPACGLYLVRVDYGEEGQSR